MNKRIGVFKEHGEVTVICIRRKEQNIWEPFYRDIEHIIYDFDLPSSEHIFKRWNVSKKYQNAVYKMLNKIKPDIIYTAGLDSLIVHEN